MADTELKRCPWCPEAPAPMHITDGRFEHNMGWAVGCDNIDCLVQPMTDSFETKEEAIAAWNTRAQ